MQREVRDLERTLASYLVGSPHSLNAKFARLEQALLLLNLERPAEIAMYKIDETLMSAEEVRGFLTARFDEQAVQSLKLPWETTKPST